MILPDLNLLVYAHNRAAPHHDAARAWWEDLLSRDVPIALPWAVSIGFVRLVTHPKVLRTPVSPGEALGRVEGWLARPGVRPIEPGAKHVVILRELFTATGVAASLTTDTHLAALAIEHRCELHTQDLDFGRFPGLRWRRPLDG